MNKDCTYSLAHIAGGDFYECYLYNEACPSEDKFLKDVSEAITKVIKEKWNELVEEYCYTEYDLLWLIAEELEKKGYKTIIPKARVLFKHPGKLHLEINLRKETGPPYEGEEVKEIINTELRKYYEKLWEPWIKKRKKPKTQQ